MVFSDCSKMLAFGLVASILGGCAVSPGAQTGPQQEQAEQRAVNAGMTPAQQSAFEQGAAALATGNADAAVRIFKRLTAANPGIAAAQANLGTALMMRGDDGLATAAFTRATALDPTLAKAYVRLGVLRRRSGQFEKAEAAYKAALAQDPGNRYAHLNLGILYDMYLQQPRKALAQYKRFQELSRKPDEDVAKWIKDLKRRL